MATTKQEQPQIPSENKEEVLSVDDVLEAVEEIPEVEAYHEDVVETLEEVPEEHPIEAVVEEIPEAENDEFFEDRLSPMFADIKEEEDPGFFDETIEFTAIPDESAVSAEEVMKEMEDTIIPVEEEEIEVPEATEEAELIPPPVEEEPEVEVEFYEMEEPAPEEEPVVDEDIDQIAEKLEEVGKPIWIHDKIENPSFVTGYMILKSCTCGVCGYHTNIERDVCPNCNTVMTR